MVHRLAAVGGHKDMAGSTDMAGKGSRRKAEMAAGRIVQKEVCIDWIDCMDRKRRNCKMCMELL